MIRLSIINQSLKRKNNTLRLENEMLLKEKKDLQRSIHKLKEELKGGDNNDKGR